MRSQKNLRNQQREKEEDEGVDEEENEHEHEEEEMARRVVGCGIAASVP